jgi:hypothetical protein
MIQTGKFVSEGNHITEEPERTESSKGPFEDQQLPTPAPLNLNNLTTE